MLSVGQQVDKFALKQLAQHVYEYTKKNLLFGDNINNIQEPSTNTEVLDISYDDDSGDFTIQGYEKPEHIEPKSIESKLLSMLSPAGKPCRKRIPVDVIREDMCGRIKGKGIIAQKNSIDKARRRINKKLEKRFCLKDLLIQKKGHILWNPQYQYKY